MRARLSKEQSDSLEVEVFEGEVDLDDSGRLDSRPQDVLFCRLVVFGAQALQVVQEAVEEGRLFVRRSLYLWIFWIFGYLEQIWRVLKGAVQLLGNWQTAFLGYLVPFVPQPLFFFSTFSQSQKGDQL